MESIISRSLLNNNDNMSQNKMIEFRKIYSKIRREIQSTKNHECFFCGKHGIGYCNSHTIPAFCLKYVSDEGKLGYIRTILGDKIFKNDLGVNEAGVFHLICRQCDGTIFQEYENESNYDFVPTTTMLAQIMMKNNLRMISKRLFEKELWRILTERHGYSPALNDIRQKVIDLDLEEYKKDYCIAKKSYLKPFDDDFYLNTFITLPYRVPIAFQGALTLVCDLEDICINNIYNTDPKYKTKSINIMVIPLKEKSVVLLFVEKGNKRYASFFKSFNKLSDYEKLNVINYIIVVYSEDYYFNPRIPSNVLVDLKQAAEKSTEGYSSTNDKHDNLKEVIKQHSFQNRNFIPNLLSGKYKLGE